MLKIETKVMNKDEGVSVGLEAEGKTKDLLLEYALSGISLFKKLTSEVSTTERRNKCMAAMVAKVSMMLMNALEEPVGGENND